MGDTAKVFLETIAKGKKALDDTRISWIELNQALEVAQKAFRAVNEIGEATIKVMSEFISVGSRIEQWTGQFRTLTGSLEAAQAKMETLYAFAAKTPFTLPEIIESAVLLEAYGIGAERQLKAAGDMAAAFGRSLGEATQALAAAATGEMEPLKRWGVVVDDIRQKIGHDLVRDTKEGLAEIATAVTEIFEERAAGAMEELAQTLKGTISMLSDAWFRFRKMVADAELFDSAKAIFGEILDIVNALFTSGKAQRFGSIVGETLSDIMWEIAFVLAAIADSMLKVLDWLSSQREKFKTDDTATWPFPRWFLDPKAAFPPKLTTSTTIEGQLRSRRVQMQDERALAATGFIPGLYGDFGLGQMPEYGYGPVPGVSYMPPPLAPTSARGLAGERAGAPARPFDVPRGEGEIPMLGEVQEKRIELSEQEIEQAYAVLDAWAEVHESLMRGWDTYYTHIGKAAQKWGSIEKATLRDVASAMKAGLRSSFAEWTAIKGQEEGLEAMMDLADAATAIASGNLPQAAAYVLSAGKHAAIGTAMGVAGGFAMKGADSDYEPGGETVSAGDAGARSRGRSVSQTAGIRTQNLTINLNIAYHGPVFHGEGGEREFWYEHMLPLAQESIDYGQLGEA